MSGDQSQTLEEFAISGYDALSSPDPFEREVATMITAELLEFLSAGS